MSIIKADYPTKLIDRHGNTLAIVLGFQYISGNMVFPVFACARPGMSEDEAIQHPDLSVSHPASQKWFETVDNWTNYAEDAEWQAAAATQTINEAIHAELKAAPPTAAQKAAFKAANAHLEKPTPGAPIKFGTDTFKSKSFWRWAEVNAVFEIEPDNALPKDPRAVKIKRDEFVQLKKDGASKIDPHAGVVDEAPAVEDDDDMDDVI